MAEDDRYGQDWNDAELDAIVADYFLMLADELAGKKYVKLHHCKAMMQLLGRSHRSVEFKHQNISAVTEILGLPWIHSGLRQRGVCLRIGCYCPG